MVEEFHSLLKELHEPYSSAVPAPDSASRKRLRFTGPLDGRSSGCAYRNSERTDEAFDRRNDSGVRNHFPCGTKGSQWQDHSASVFKRITQRITNPVSV